MHLKDCKRHVVVAQHLLTLTLLVLSSHSFSQSAPSTPHNIPLPEDTKILAPSASEPSDARVFSGSWMGEWVYYESGFSFQHILVVERIINGAAEVIYATGPASSETRSSAGRWVRRTGTIERGILSVPVSPDITVKYSISSENELSGNYIITSMTMRSTLKRTSIAPARLAELVPLPEGARALIQEPDPQANPQTASFSGAWSGWWDGSLPHVLVVSKVQNDKVDVICAVGSHFPPRQGWRPNSARVAATITDETLSFKPRSGADVSYKYTSDGRLEGAYVINGTTSRALLNRTDVK